MSDVVSRIRILNGNDVNILTQSVDLYKHNIKASDLRKMSNGIMLNSSYTTFGMGKSCKSLADLDPTDFLL